MDTATLTLSRDAMRPRPADGLGKGALLAILVHLLLIAVLAFGVNWHAHEPEGVVAELWSAVPQVAAPRAVTPPPAPTPAPAPKPTPAPEKQAAPRPAPEPPRLADAQIAIEKARRDDAKHQADEREALLRKQQQQQRDAQKQEALKQENQKQEAQKQEARKVKAERDKAAAEAARRDELRREQLAKEADERKKKELAEQARKEEATLVAQREANLKRIQGQAGATGDEGSTGSAARNSGPSASYAGRIRARIKPNILLTDSIDGNPVATVEVRCATDGTIVSRKLVKSSGSKTWDEAVLRAIDRTEVLPRDTDGRVPPVLQIDFKPRD
ncbi:MAG: cell envelope integrity protein TolA [Pseudomonadota bacterium]|nr:cell envelope integrity protein TolA [Pseudomonadota bacterium]